jgi:hypothetical protein
VRPLPQSRIRVLWISKRVVVEDAVLTRQVVGCGTASAGERDEGRRLPPTVAPLILCNPDDAHGQRAVVGPFWTSKPGGIARARNGRCNAQQ